MMFLLLRGIHFVAAIVILAILILYFNTSYKETEETAKESPQSTIIVDEDMSAYEVFCNINSDANCNSTDYNEYEADDNAKIILMDNGENELDKETKDHISSIVEQGHNLNISANPEDVNAILDNLYEETLPDDIIDEFGKKTAEVVEIKNDKMKKLYILPSRKPPYFGDKPVVVIVIDDMGISQKRTADIASLKAPITASFLTYGKKLNEQIQNSIKNGQEIMIHVPMEAKSNVDAAPDVLTTSMTKSEIKKNLLQMLKKFKDVKGINNHMGSKLTEDYDRMKTIMEVLKDNDLYFLDSKTSPKSKAEKAAADSGIAYAHRHVFLDNKNDKAYILGQLGKTEKLARKNGYAIAIGHPKTQTYVALKEWLPKVQNDGIKIIPLSEAIKVLNP